MYAWQAVPWRKVERAVFKLQQRIDRASCHGDFKTVHQLQRLLLTSWYAKLLATRRVTQDTRGKRTAGVDGVKSLSPPQRLHFARTLRLVPMAQPVRRVWVPKSGSAERRPIGIPVMQERAGQVLVKLALEPEWEAKFEPNSDGFRPGRSCHDAVEAMPARLTQQDTEVLEADLEKGFDRWSHSALMTKLETCPPLSRVMVAGLKAGVLEGDALLPTTAGAPPGAVRSPRLMNVALHGLDTAIPTAFPTQTQGRSWRPKVVRVADDFVVLHRDHDVGRQAKAIASTWLSEGGRGQTP